MRRLMTARAPEPDDSAREGFDRLDLEGDPIAPPGDELPWLPPLCAAGAGPGLGGARGAAGPEAVRIPRQARELAALGRRLDAMLLLRRFLDDAAGDAAARALLAALLEEGGEPEEALQELDRAVADCDDPGPILVQRGALLARRGRTAEAERDLREAIRRRPGYAAAHYHLGVALFRGGRLPAAGARVGARGRRRELLSRGSPPGPRRAAGCPHRRGEDPRAGSRSGTRLQPEGPAARPDGTHR